MDCLSSVNWNKITPCLVFLLLDIFLEFSECASQAEVNKHLELGRDFLARGQLSDALTHYHAAVEGDPNNYLTYFKRGTVYYALGKAKFALQDFTKVLELKPDFATARLHRANVYYKLAEYNNAKDEYYHILVSDPHNEEVQHQYIHCDELSEQVRLSEALYRGRDYHSAIETISHLLEVSPWAHHLRQLRAECYIAMNDLLSAASDLRSVNRLQQDSTSGFYRLAMLLYQLGHIADALKEVRECLRLDPEHKQCFPLYKQMKKVNKLLETSEESYSKGDYSQCITMATKATKAEQSVPMVQFEGYRLLCSCSVKAGQYSEAIGNCNSALEINKEPEVLCDKADALVELEMYDDAIRTYKEAQDIDNNSQRAKEGIGRTQRVRANAEKRDYYKILGVSRSATKQEITKAYRKAAQKWHPDSYQGDEKKLAEKKFIDVAAAKEVLTDPEKRAQFDAGHDPLDPESGRNGNSFHPFQHFQHGSPFQFKFHFS